MNNALTEWIHEIDTNIKTYSPSVLTNSFIDSQNQLMIRSVIFLEFFHSPCKIEKIENMVENDKNYSKSNSTKIHFSFFVILVDKRNVPP